MTPLLQVENVRRTFGGLVALNNVNFSAAPGHIKAVIGPNGAGKTTLFNVISGLIKPDTGRITFKGKEISRLAPYEIAAEGISRTFQNPSLFLHLSVLENVMIGRHTRSHCGFFECAVRWPGQRAEEKALKEAAMAHLEFVGLTRLADVKAGSLSFGQRRMVELARSLATEPELLLLDEPGSGLNHTNKKQLSEMILKVRERNVTMLLIEHDMSMIMNLSDDILVLHNGTPIAEGTPETIQNDPKVISVYLGE